MSDFENHIVGFVATRLIFTHHSRVFMDAKFLHDVSIPDTTTVQPGTKLLKTWRMKNAGDGPWSDSTKVGTLDFIAFYSKISL